MRPMQRKRRLLTSPTSSIIQMHWGKQAQKTLKSSRQVTGRTVKSETPGAGAAAACVSLCARQALSQKRAADTPYRKEIPHPIKPD